jgi:hypothetical protein
MIGPMCEHLYALNVFFLNFFNALLIAWLAYARHLYAFQFILFLFLKTFIGRLIGLCTALYALNLFYFYLIFNDRLAYVWAFICSQCILFLFNFYWLIGLCVTFICSQCIFISHLMFIGRGGGTIWWWTQFFSNRKFKRGVIF